MPVPYVSPRFQAIDGNGNPLVGGKLYTYANTTTTPQDTYQDAAGTIANTNPIILDSQGQAVIFLTESQVYTFVLKDKNDALIWSQDSITGSETASGGITVVTSIPASDTGGPVYLPGYGIYAWNGTAYVGDYSQGFNSGAYSHRNKIINGCFRLWQRGIGIGPITSASANPYTADRWRMSIGGSASVTIAQQAATSDYGQGRVGGFSALLTSGASATPGASDKNRFSQAIEGQNLLSLALGSLWGGNFTLSFWVRSSIVGTYSVAFLNGGSPSFRAYIANYTVNSAATWELKTVTVPIDQAGISNWNRGASIGMQVVFDLGSGSSSEGVANTWLSTESTRTTGSVSLISHNTATLEFSNVQLEYGATATPFEDRQFGTEFLLCQRYFEMSYPLGTPIAAAPSVFGSHACMIATGFLLDFPTIRFLVPKRTVPSLAFYSPQSGTIGVLAEYNAGGTFVADRSGAVNFISLLGFELNGAGTLTAGNLSRTHWVANAEL